MIQASPSPETAAPDTQETRAERVERQAKMLREMAEITMRIARAEAEVALARTALAMNEAGVGVAPAGGPRIVHPVTAEADPGLSISRIGRSLRLTLAMESRLWDELEAGPKVVAAEPKAELSAPELSPEERHRQWLERRGTILSASILPVVEAAIDAAETSEGDGGDSEARMDHLNERLEDRELLISFGTLSIGESALRLCREIGVEPDWELWRDKHWAIEEAEAETPGSPYGRPWPDPPTPRLRRASP